MIELPLFPLNTVLFPGMPINLHIFEDRYKLMINECIERRQPFGVILIAEGEEAHGPVAEPHRIGCTARITQVQPLRQGRMNITAVGQERFQLVSINRDRPYLVGTVEPYPIATADEETVKSNARKLRNWVQRYLLRLQDISDVQFDVRQAPHDPVTLVYLAAVLLQVPQGEKQELLAVAAIQDLLDELRTIYRRETALLDALLEPPKHSDFQGSFSLN